MTSKKYTNEEIGERADKIYEGQIKRLVEPQENGKFIVIDVESGDYEIDRDSLAAEDRLMARQPNAIGFLTRVGPDTAFHIGWRGSGIRFSDQ